MMQKLNAADSIRYRRMTTEELRGHFLLGLFTAGKIDLVYTNADRAVAGSAVPLDKPLALAAEDELRSAYFLERRELGVVNIGGPGRINVGGVAYAMARLDGLYVGRENREVVFESISRDEPAAFYLLSYPAHATYPTTQARNAETEAIKLGEQAACNRRTIYKYIHPAGIRSCQLVMGVTLLEEGSVWNTMPCHTHDRRSEIYLYFGMQPETRIVHLMGEPDETRHVIVADRQAVVSPSWSIHSGVGTGAYAFCWGMGGENQAFNDMDAVPMTYLR